MNQNSEKNSLYFTISLRPRRQRFAGLWKNSWCLWRRCFIKISSTQMVCSFSFWKFRCQRRTALWSTNRWKSRWNSAKNWGRPAHFIL